MVERMTVNHKVIGSSPIILVKTKHLLGCGGTGRRARFRIA